jgi:hypothetical protein
MAASFTPSERDLADRLVVSHPAHAVDAVILAMERPKTPNQRKLDSFIAQVRNRAERMERDAAETFLKHNYAHLTKLCADFVEASRHDDRPWPAHLEGLHIEDFQGGLHTLSQISREVRERAGEAVQ